MRPRIRKLKQFTRMVFPRRAGNDWLFFSSSDRKLLHKVGDGSSASVVMAPLLWIGRNFPEAPPAMWQKMPDSGEEERVIGRGEQGGDHLMLELLERPNPFYSGPALWQATVIDYHLSGNGYWIKLRDRGRRPQELWWAPSYTMKPIGDEETYIKHYEYRVGARMTELQPEDVVHFRYSLDPEDPRRGRSPLSSLLQEVFTDTEAAEFTATILGNMGIPGVVVSPKNTDVQPTAQDVKDTKAYIKEAYSGSRRGEPLVMSGPTSVSQFGFSPQQMALREIRRIPEERVSAALGVPAIVAGLGAGLDRSTFANYAEAREAAYQDNIIPAQRSLSEEVRFQLLPDFEPDGFWAYRFGFDLSNVRVLQEDRNALAQRFDTGIRGGWIRVSEGRRAMDLEVDDADEIYLRPVNVIEVTAGEAGNAPVPSLSPGQEPAQPALPPGEQPALPAPMPMASLNGNGNLKARRLTQVDTALKRVMILDQVQLSSVFARELKSEFAAFGQLCAAEYQRIEGTSRSYAVDGVLVKQQIDAGVLATMITRAVSDQMSEKLTNRFRAHVERTIQQTVDTINLVTGLGIGVSDARQMKILEAGGKRVGLIDLETQTRSSIFSAINSGNQEGLGPIQIARNIRQEVPAGPYVNSGPGYRSQLIARTETNWAQNTSTISAYREADTVQSCIAMDGSDDPECAARDGQEFSFDDAEEELSKEHPNGTLCFSPVIGDGASLPAPDEVYMRETAEVSSLVRNMAGETDTGDIDEALLRIGSVHKYPGESMPVNVKISGTTDDAFGSYNSMYKSLTIAEDLPNAVWTRETLYHEMGHYLDNQLLGKSKFLSGKLGASKKKYAPMEKLMRTIKGVKEFGDLDKDGAWWVYMNSPQELFARAYSQYIAEVAGDKEALDLLRGAEVATQWSADEFASIKQAFDVFFSETELAV